MPRAILAGLTLPASRPLSIPRWWSGVAAVALGCLVIAAIYGPGILAPWRTGWMLEGTIGPDPVQYWLGWTYFSRAPWSWPPGLNPDWGLEIGSSIFYSDSIPLLAFAFKALRPLMEVSQYWGLWLYACGALQALMAWRIIGLFTADPLARLAGAALFLVQPLILNRLGGHFALGGQFLLLMALYLCLTREPAARRLAGWAALVGASSLIHAYLLPMVAGLWATDLLARALRDGRRPAWLGMEALAVPLIGLCGLWLAGFFVLQSGLGGTWGGFGRMQLDLLAPFDPGEWGRFLPQLPRADHLEAADSYLGLGVLLLLAAGLIAFLARPGMRPGWPLLAGLAVFMALAVTHRVSIGGWVVTVLDLPERAVSLADALRASVRFFWPVAYAAMVGAIAALVHALGGRRAGLVLAGLLVVQVADLQPGVARLHGFFRPAPATAPLRLADPFWTQATARYERIRLAPTGMQARHWEEVAVLAATRGLPTDAVYLARLDPERVAALNATTLARLSTGRHERGSLYVLGDKDALAAAWAGMDPTRDLLRQADGIWVLAPGWLQPLVAAHTGASPPP
ncbi:hypothetical protein G3576_21440 [Roseomonas stagni]|uniref:Glycosyltransferase RgtA/B/C/D-like domain-containing protein n=1 Tax=Falsiroseomonas algicola TaxID=2716930 RepID=A0A6M1LRE4_9PROT|nr:DUF6311 domain-containing protein [Falsiroseomonas algicola]NGM22592.1 hypothetical protein [Falsiroseomonas algicola]